jgi:hypothetical protein
MTKRLKPAASGKVWMKCLTPSWKPGGMWEARALADLGESAFPFKYEQRSGMSEPGKFPEVVFKNDGGIGHNGEYEVSEGFADYLRAEKAPFEYVVENA